jgi:hypothetical protein
MKALLFLSLFCFICAIGISQTKISYEYDNHGARKLRKQLTLKSAEINTDTSSTSAIGDSSNFQEKLGQSFISIFPNPTKSFLKIQTKSLAEGLSYTIRLTDMVGRMFYSTEETQPECIVDMNNYKSGTYILIIKIGDESTEWKIIKE